jgi:type IV pilus assembly protein PilC
VSFLSPRIGLKPLIGLCRRLSTALGAGVDVRTVLAREAERARGSLRDHLLTVSQSINQGQSLAEALVPTGDFFPTLFRELIALGEHTGQLDAVLTQLADSYQNQLDMRRSFQSAIIWPVAQLIAAVLVVGFSIWIMGIVQAMSGNKTIDPLGFGLIGNRGLAIYAALVGSVGVLLWLIGRAIARGMVWTRPIQLLVLRIPVIGNALQTLALARMAWSLQVTLDAGMDIRQVLKLSLRSTRNARYIDQIPLMDAEVSAGHSLHETFCLAGGYPPDFLDTLAVGEQSGRLVESMGILARQYQDQAKAALALLAVGAAWAVWAVVVAVIVVLIFRMFSFYLGALAS